MKYQRLFRLILALLLIMIIMTGCGSTEKATQATVESGVIDKDYVGVVAPVLPQDYKIEEKAKEGMIKVTIKCGVEKEIPVGGSEEEQEKSGDSDEAKPKI